MNIPRFTAEAGLYKTKGYYYGANGSGTANHNRSIIPQATNCSTTCPIFNIFTRLACCAKTCTTCVTQASGEFTCNVKTTYSGNACGQPTTVIRF
jgi:hypothetical protein